MMITEEMERAELVVCKGLAQKYMPGTRDGSDRPSWKHAEDVAQAVARLESLHPEGWSFWVSVAWLHDLLEDGEGLDQARLSQDLEASGIISGRAAELARMVQILSKEKGEGAEYFQRIAQCGHWQLSLVKVLDRLANLREGRGVFTKKRWRAYVKETEENIVPLLANVEKEAAVGLLLELGRAMVGGGSATRGN